MNAGRAEWSGGSARAATVLLTLLSACGGRAESGALDTPITLTQSGASNPTVAVDPRAGASYVAWVGSAGGEWNVYLARSERDGVAYSEPVRVNDQPGDAALHEQAPAQVAVGPEGNVYVVWQNNTPVDGRRFPASDVRLARSTDGGRTFEPAITVNDDAGGPPSSHTFHNIVVADDGTVYVSWIDSRVRDSLRAERPASSDMHATHGAVAVDEPAGPEIRVARSTDGGRSFGPSVVVDSNACPCCRTSLAVGPDGTLYIAWRKIHDGDVRDVVIARSGPGELDFSNPEPVHEDGWVFPGCPHAGPSVAIDSAGRVHVGWYTGADGRQGIWYARSEDGGRTFVDPVPLITDEWVPPSQVKLAAAGDRVWIVWGDRREQPAHITLARVVEEAPHRVGESDSAGTSPALAAVPGSAVVAWHDGEVVRVDRVVD